VATAAAAPGWRTSGSTTTVTGGGPGAFGMGAGGSPVDVMANRVAGSFEMVERANRSMAVSIERAREMIDVRMAEISRRHDPNWPWLEPKDPRDLEREAIAELMSEGAFRDQASGVLPTLRRGPTFKSEGGAFRPFGRGAWESGGYQATAADYQVLLGGNDPAVDHYRRRWDHRQAQANVAGRLPVGAV